MLQFQPEDYNNPTSQTLDNSQPMSLVYNVSCIIIISLLRQTQTLWVWIREQDYKRNLWIEEQYRACKQIKEIYFEIQQCAIYTGPAVFNYSNQSDKLDQDHSLDEWNAQDNAVNSKWTVTLWFGIDGEWLLPALPLASTGVWSSDVVSWQHFNEVNRWLWVLV